VASTYISYQLQFKNHKSDKFWSVWCQDKNLEKIQGMKVTMLRIKNLARIVKLETMVTVIEE
jgi:hypothetical protein